MPKFFTDLLPGVDNSVNLGASGTEFKNLHIDGTAHIVTAAFPADTDPIGIASGLSGVSHSIGRDSSTNGMLLMSGTGTDIILDAADDIYLDAGGNNVYISDDGTDIGLLRHDGSNNFVIKSEVSDGNINFQGNDGGSTISALRLDMSEAGKALFNAGLEVNDEIIFQNQGAFLRMEKSSWSNADTHDLVYQGWNTNTGDYIYLKAPGNSTNDHGVAFIGDSVIAFGQTDVEIGAPELTSGSAPLDQNWLVLNSSGATFSADITVTGGDITLSGTGRIQGVDTVTAGTDAVNKTYCDGNDTTGSAASLSGLSYGDIVIGGETGYEKLSGNAQSSNKFLRSRGAANAAAGPTWETVTRSDVSGTTTVAQGGTGQTSLSSGRVLIGNGTSAVAVRSIGIQDDNIVEIDDADVASGDFAKFTAAGLQGRSASEVRADLELRPGTDIQALVTFGLSNTNSVKIDSANVASGEFAKFTSSGLESRTAAEVLSDIGAQAAGSYLTSVATSNIADNAVTLAKMQDMTRGSIIAANNSGFPTELTIGSNGQVLKADANGDIVWANESGGTAGTLIDISSGTINVDLTEATAATIADGDFILFLDGGTNSAAAKGDIHDVANLFAGTGLTATDSVISVNLGNGLAMDGTDIAIDLDGSTLALGQNGIKVGTAQDTIQTIYNTSLIVGRASSDMAIEFNTADQIDITHNGTTYARFDNDGDLFLARDWHIGQSFSDIKLKENIKDFKNGLDAILKLKPVTFDWKDKERGSNHTGFIAQDVEKIIPNAVNKRKKLEDDNLNEYLSIDNSQIIATLTKAVQEQQKQINELKEIINGISK